MGILNLKMGIRQQLDSPLGKEASKYIYRNRIEQIFYIILCIVIVGVMIYFGLIELFTGDPFKNAWGWDIGSLYPGQLIPILN
jgi:hypothetical protein